LAIYQYDILIVVPMLHKRLSLEDEEYPALLKEIPGPPQELHIRGKIPSDAPAIAIVGTRRASWQGKRLAQAFARELTAVG